MAALREEIFTKLRVIRRAEPQPPLSSIEKVRDELTLCDTAARQCVALKQTTGVFRIAIKQPDVQTCDKAAARVELRREHNRSTSSAGAPPDFECSGFVSGCGPAPEG